MFQKGKAATWPKHSSYFCKHLLLGSCIGTRSHQMWALCTPHLVHVIDRAEDQGAHSSIHALICKWQLFSSACKQLERVAHLLKSKLCCFMCIWLHLGVGIHTSHGYTLSQEVGGVPCCASWRCAPDTYLASIILQIGSSANANLYQLYWLLVVGLQCGKQLVKQRCFVGGNLGFIVAHAWSLCVFSTGSVSYNAPSNTYQMPYCRQNTCHTMSIDHRCNNS